MSSTARHCPTCTCAPSRGGFCDSSVTVLHETFDCLEPYGHAGVHVGGEVPPPCTVCHGYETHAGDCPQIGPAGDPGSFDAPYEVQWDDEGTVTFALSPDWKNTGTKP